MSNGIEDIAAERRRQVEAEGWTPEHDDQWSQGELCVVGAGYALVSIFNEEEREKMEIQHPEFWPDTWDRSWWKPKDRRADLVRAGALIAAEIDRLDRASPTPASGD